MEIKYVSKEDKECGGFTLDIPGYEQPVEMIMFKEL